MGKIDDEIRPEFDTIYREVVLNPVTNFSGYFPKVNALAVKRSRKLLDYDAAKSKVKTETEKPFKKMSKLDEVTNAAFINCIA